jgi:hypothetical protein
MSLLFAVVAEAPADHRIASDLADRVLVDAIPDWLDEELLPHQRRWVIEASGTWLTWKNIRKLARSAGIEAEGFFDGEPALPDARAARRALRYLRSAIPELKAVMLIRDQDDQKERRNGLEQARCEDHEGLEIVIGLAIPEREAWVLSGFEPQDDDERKQLDEERQALGFFPHEQSHELNACKDDFAPRSPKRVLRVLVGGRHDRESECWTRTSLQVLQLRGTANGLAEFLQEVRTRLAPLIGHVPKETSL